MKKYNEKYFQYIGDLMNFLNQEEQEHIVVVGITSVDRFTDDGEGYYLIFIK